MRANPAIICKRHLTLLELVIALFLSVMVFSVLSFFYYQVNVINVRMDKLQTEAFTKLYVENRLSSVLPKTLFSKDLNNDFHFFTTPDSGLFMPGTSSLVFSFDNGVQLDKKMAYHVIGRLFLDREGRLMLAKWPAEKRWPENDLPPLAQEVLLENVEEMHLFFYQPAEPPVSNAAEHAAATSASKRGTWEREWSKEKGTLPAIVKIVLKIKRDSGESEEVAYAFPLPHTTYTILYH